MKMDQKMKDRVTIFQMALFIPLALAVISPGTIHAWDKILFGSQVAQSWGYWGDGRAAAAVVAVINLAGIVAVRLEE